MIPSVNAKDNLYQGTFVLVTTALAALIGFLYGGTSAHALLFCLVGLIGSAFISGFVLMLLGLQRSAKKKPTRQSEL